MPTLSVDGKSVVVPAGVPLLQAIRRAGANVPTLCAHPALEPTGGCRLCLVDVVAHAGGAPRMVVACMYPVAEGLVVDTRSERVLATRRVVVDLLLARCPETPLVQRLARELGVERTSYRPNPKPTDCVLCGLCTRVCEQLGASAIASAQRGVAREIAAPFGQPPPDCVGCGACAHVCPTGFISLREEEGTRTIWDRRFEMLRCRECGRPHMTEAMAGLLTKRQGISPDHFELCDQCKRAKLARTAAALAAAS